MKKLNKLERHILTQAIPKMCELYRNIRKLKTDNRYIETGFYMGTSFVRLKFDKDEDKFIGIIYDNGIKYKTIYLTDEHCS